MSIELLGVACILLSNCIMLPQLYRIYKNKSAQDVSLGMLVLGMFAQALWTIYGLQIGDKPLWISSSTAFVIGGIVLAAYLHYDKEHRIWSL